MAKQQHSRVHGVFVKIEQLGVLITGASGIGKSETALQLIDRNHQLIADDVVEFTFREQKIIGYCPAPLQDFLKIHGLDIFNIRKLYGDAAICCQHNLDLIIHLAESVESDPLCGLHDTQALLGNNVARVTLATKQCRNLALLVEAVTKTHRLKIQGYNAQQEFIQQHNKIMDVKQCA